ELLLDRALEQGGVNYGNRRIFGVSLEAIPGPTAVMLLALQGRPADERVTAAVEFLRRQADEGEDLEHLCWARLALDAYSDLPGRVHIAPAGDYKADLADVLRRQYEDFRERVPLAGKRVVLKPNLVEYHRDKVINTHPHVVAAAIELCRREGAAEVLVAEGPGHCRNVEHLVSASGLGDVLRHYRVPFVDLNH